MSYEDYSIKFMLNDTEKEKRKNIILKMIKEETDLDIVREVLDAAKDKLNNKPGVHSPSSTK